MHPALFLIVIIPAVTFWLLIRLFIQYFFYPVVPVKILGITFQGIIPKNQNQFAGVFASVAGKEILKTDLIHQKLAAPETLQNALPLIDQHIDHFINVKLKESLPVISMFIGEQVTSQLKELFIKELEELFPSVMAKFIDGFMENSSIEKEIAFRINAIPVKNIEDNFYRLFKKELNKIEFTFALGGFITGLIQVIVILLA